MTERLQRIHAMLRAGNVPCALSTEPGLGVVLQAGTPDSGVWDVMVRDSAGRLFLDDARGATVLAAGSTDSAVSDTIKLHVVQAWADQGDPAATAVIATLRERTASGATGYGQPRTQAAPNVFVIDLMSLFDPLHVVDRMIDVGNLFGNALLAWSPAAASFSLWSPWGTVQGGYHRR